MPDVVGCSFDPVNAILRRYEPRIQKRVVARSQPDGQIVGQSPNPGEPFPKPGMLIVFTVSDGSVAGTDSLSSQVSPLADLTDLSVTGTVDPAGPYRPGETVKFSMDVSNAGPTVAKGIQVDEVPTNLTIQKIYGGCTAFPCSLMDLDPDSTASIWMTAVIAGEGNFNSSVGATFSGRDSNLSNNWVDFGGNAEPQPPSGIGVKDTTKDKNSPRRMGDTVYLNNHLTMRWYSRIRVPALVIIGLLAVFKVLTRKLRRTRWRHKTAVRASLERGGVPGACEPLSFTAPRIQLRAVLEPGNATPDGLVVIVREEVLDD
jgi:uncharacterized repeat protein (TIGR01451 family)